VFGRERIEYKSPAQVLLMRRAGLVVAAALQAVREAVRPGVSTAELDAVADDVIRSAGAVPSFKGYHGFPATLCTSVNDEVVHGIPGPRRIEAGDLLSVDCGAIVEGWHGDAAFSMVVEGGPVAAGSDLAADAELVRVTEQALWRGIAALDRQDRLHDVGTAVEDCVDGRYGIVEDYVGHGIGTAMHQAPQVPNLRTRERGPRVRPGLCVAVEPMLVRGPPDTRVLDDDWTVVTLDGSRAAHWEHTVAVLPDGLWVLTAPDGGARQLEALGVRLAALDGDSVTPR
jgi:methionyl aminopeptidase